MRSIVFAIALLMCWGVSCIAQDLSPVNGVYLSKRDDTQFLTLRQDSTFVLKQRKSPPDKNDPFVEYTGKYQLDGENIKLILDDGGTAQGTVKGNIFTDGQGDIWVKKGTEQENVVRPKYKPWWR